MVAKILDAARLELQEMGVVDFTTKKVADRAGISPGSLYQYIPDKHALLINIQLDELRYMHLLAESCFNASDQTRFTRLRSFVILSLRYQCKNAALHEALRDAAPFYRDSIHVKDALEGYQGTLYYFLSPLLPGMTKERHNMAIKAMTTMIQTTGAEFAHATRKPDEMDMFADFVVDMIEAYVGQLRS
ncbi:MAG: TetR family transcriptional regulator [Methylobacterium mesophilicum]|nr:TetR family transcriptional regulator [Methylobacterium mesophilicum]